MLTSFWHLSIRIPTYTSHAEASSSVILMASVLQLPSLNATEKASHYNQGHSRIFFSAKLWFTWRCGLHHCLAEKSNGHQGLICQQKVSLSSLIFGNPWRNWSRWLVPAPHHQYPTLMHDRGDGILLVISLAFCTPDILLVHVSRQFQFHQSIELPPKTL